MAKIDNLDLKILSELSNDASVSVPKLSKKINVNSSVVYSRIKRLLKQKLIQYLKILPPSKCGIFPGGIEYQQSFLDFKNLKLI